jgi:hypothetical protein
MTTERVMVGLLHLYVFFGRVEHSVRSVYVWETLSELPYCIDRGSVGQAANKGSRALTAMQCRAVRRMRLQISDGVNVTVVITSG